MTSAFQHETLIVADVRQIMESHRGASIATLGPIVGYSGTVVVRE